MLISVPLLTFLLAALVALTPLAVDMYLPAMQMIAADLQTPIHQVELSISSYLLGFAAGQVVGGAVSDRFGRKPVVLAGMLVFMLSSGALIYVDSIDGLLFWRVLQAFGGGIAVVNASAIVRDLYAGNDVARVLSMIASVMMMAPLLAPLIGALITELSGWRSIFAVLAIYALLVVIGFIWKVPESRVSQQDSGRPGMLAAYLKIVRNRLAMSYVLALSFAFSGMFAFITAAPFAYLEHFGATPLEFTYLFGANIVTMIFFSRLNVRWVNRFGPNRLLLAGLLTQALAGLGLVIAAQADLSLTVVVLLNILFVGVLGLVAANATASCLELFPEISASANAVIGVVEFSMGALVGVLWASIHDDSLMPMVAVMAACALLGLVSGFYSRYLRAANTGFCEG